MLGTWTHVGFADESSWNLRRFRSAALVSATRQHALALHAELQQRLVESDVSEVNWKSLRTARYRFAVMKFLESVLTACGPGNLRVDVVVWDIRDSRHDVPGRDDTANLERMYFHLFRNVLRARWPDDATWALFPDERDDLDWSETKDILSNAGTSTEIGPSVLRKGGLTLRLRKFFQIEKIEPSDASELPLVQVADLFAGMASYSHEFFPRYEIWEERALGQERMANVEKEKLSSGDDEKCRVLRYFATECRSRSLGVSLNSRRGLWTADPRRSLNFWRYQPQVPDDTAPTRR